MESSFDFFIKDIFFSFPEKEGQFLGVPKIMWTMYIDMIYREIKVFCGANVNDCTLSFSATFTKYSEMEHKPLVSIFEIYSL